LKPYEKLQKFWQLSDAQVAESGASETEIEGLEQKYSIRLPSDFRDYLRHSCPKDEEAGYDDATSWWHLSRIRNIPEEYEHAITDPIIARDSAKYLFFADYAIWCWAWAICCDNGENRGRVAVISGRDRLVADSFTEFAVSYVTDQKRLA
jgi:hypothetical protein